MDTPERGDNKKAGIRDISVKRRLNSNWQHEDVPRTGTKKVHLKEAKQEAHKQNYYRQKQAIDVLIARLDAIEKGQIKHSGKTTTRLLETLHQSARL